MLRPGILAIERRESTGRSSFTTVTCASTEAGSPSRMLKASRFPPISRDQHLPQAIHSMVSPGSAWSRASSSDSDNVSKGIDRRAAKAWALLERAAAKRGIDIRTWNSSEELDRDDLKSDDGCFTDASYSKCGGSQGPDGAGTRWRKVSYRFTSSVLSMQLYVSVG